MLRTLACPFLALLTGCGAACDPASLGPSTTEASVDGASFAATGTTWSRPGEGIQIASGTDGTWSLTVVAQSSTDGTTAGAAVEGDLFPFEVSLAGGGPGFATIYPADGSASYSSNGESGTVTFHDLVDGELHGCFEFTASGDDGTIQAEGAFRAANAVVAE